MSEINAWVLDFGMEHKAAVGGRELLHLLDNPAIFTVPCTPSYCRRVVSWQGRLLPVMDIASRLCGKGVRTQYIGVIGYQQKRGEYPQFGALSLASPPLKISVSDEQACDLPEEIMDWKEIAISCFDFHGTALPVLNLKLLFNSTAY